MRINLGCGSDIMDGYTNVDSADLPGVDVVHDLTDLPWPLADESATEVRLINVLEHLPDTVTVIEELHRITATDGVVTVRVPFYNSPDMFADPTHQSFFSERTLDFFDPERRACQQRPYYSTARFTVRVAVTYCRLFGVYLPVRFGFGQRCALWLSRRLAGVVWVIEFELTRRPAES